MTAVGFAFFGLAFLIFAEEMRNQSTLMQIGGYLLLCAILSGLTGHTLW